MPIFEYTCTKCGSDQEHLVSYADRDKLKCAGACGGKLERHEVHQVIEGKPSFQGGAVLADGRRIKGHFGRDARKKGGWHRP